MTYCFRRCKKLLRHLSSHERQCLMNCMQPSMTLKINEDLLKLICGFLPTHDRLSFLTALLCDKHTDRVVHARIHRYPSLLPDFLQEYATRALTSAAYRFGEKMLYMLPQAARSFGTIVCDWSPFAKKKFAPVAHVYWSQVYPHMRIDLLPQLRRVVTHSLSGNRPVVRLTGHFTVSESNVQVCIEKMLFRISLTPSLCEEVFLLTNSGMNVSCLYNKSVRHMIAHASMCA